MDEMLQGTNKLDFITCFFKQCFIRIFYVSHFVVLMQCIICLKEINILYARGSEGELAGQEEKESEAKPEGRGEAVG